jgi:hypothetical protein
MSETSLNKTEILARAKLKWDSKDNANRVRAGSKYQHFLDKFKLQTNDWTNDFDHLSPHQQNVITKGELIRTYDSLPNISKTSIMREFGLSLFSSKWYKLPGKDKKILLNYVIR